jgi:hypothetical protein
VNPSDSGQAATFTAAVTSGAAQPHLFVANLNGAQAGTNSTATGSATVFLSADEKTARVRLSFTGLSSPQFNAHILGGAPGTIGTIIVLPAGNPLDTTVSLGTFPSNDAQNLKGGFLSIDVSSDNFGGGEIRGLLQPATVAPTGMAQFKIDGSIFGPPVALNNGVAQLTTSSLASGTHTITANYSGDANFLPSSGTLAGGQVVKPPPSLSINDVSITEGDAGTKTLNFTVTRSAASNATASVNFATANGTASAQTDYVATNGTLTFNPGDLTKTIGVTINGDQTFEPDETFFVNLSSAVNAAISVALGTGTGTILNDDAQGGIISLSQTSYSVSESAGFTTINVNRGGDTSGPATVDYATSDTGPLSACGAFTGQASSRCDYTTAMGTLKFAGGETQKTFVVLVSRDSYADGSEMFMVSLSNLTGGAVFGTPSTAPVTITDDTTGVPPNAIDDASIFVRQHYHDFLNREPDASGLAFWTNQITSCGADAQCTELRRINVSAAFYLSIEFQQTGYLVERIYKASYGDAIGASNFGGAHQLPVPIIRLNEFLPDTQQIGQGVVVGQTGWEQVLENNKVAFTTGFVQRARFTSPYPTFMTPAEFVDKLFLNAGMMPAKPERQAAIDEFGAASTTIDVAARGRALRRVAENATLSANEFNRAFVLMEYFGYLRRNLNEAPDSDYTGYDFWLTKLNQFNGNFVNAEMVKAFINSGEYRQRFGP